jgi:hypothetical protein
VLSKPIYGVCGSVKGRKDKERKVVMKKFALALLVLALTVPASATVVLTSAKGAGADANLVTISYNCNAGEKVRAFALDVNAGGKLLVGSAQPVPVGDVIHYYVYPGSIQFAVTGGGETYISNLGTPMAEQTVSGGVIEMASLYAAGDVNHPSAPPSSGALVKFRLNCPPGGPVTVKITLNAKRGGVVLEDPNVSPTVTLPADLVVCEAVPQNMCWICPTQTYGDATGSVALSPPDGKVNIYDLLALRKAYGTNSATSPHGKGVGQYNCCADFCGTTAGSPPDGKVNIYDLLRLRKNYGQTFGTACGDGSCL